MVQGDSMCKSKMERRGARDREEEEREREKEEKRSYLYRPQFKNLISNDRSECP